MNVPTGERRSNQRGERKRAVAGDGGGAPSHTKRKLALATLGVAVLLVGVAFVLWRRGGLTRPPEPGTRDNVLLVTLDTTRADRLGSYGHARARTRHLDALAAGGARFTHAYSPAPLTLPAHASILTGLYPFEHGVRNNGNFYLADRFPTLATRLKHQGYRTAAFVSSFIVDRRYGLDRGFDHYDDRLGGGDGQIVSLEAERRGDRTALALTRWLEAGPDEPSPFFAWLHLYDPHEPYRPPPPFREAFRDDPYDGEIAFADAIVASVMDALDRLGAKARTLVVIVGDHGESLGDHGEETHSMFVYESAIRVPLILWRPGVVPAAAVVETPVRATDVAATVLELVGAPALETPHGRSLVPLLGASTEPGAGGRDSEAPAIYAETLLPRFYMNWAPLRAISDGRWKLIDAPKPELYDLSRDPDETRNLHAAEPQRAAALRRALETLTGGAAGEMTVARLDREALEKLASLGYIGAGPSTEPGAEFNNRGAADPKDVIAVFNRLRRANSAVRERRFAEALPILREVLAADPRNAFATLVLGSAYMGQGQYTRAIEQYRRYLTIVPTSAYAHHWLAICYLRIGDQGSAAREAEAALAIDPNFTDARVLRAGVLASRGDHASATRELEQAIATDPAKHVLRLDLANVLAEAGRTAEAEQQYRTVLDQQPGFAPALVGLGALAARGGRLDEAAALFHRALAANPSQTDARLNLAEVYVRQGRRDAAAAELTRVAEDTGAPSSQRSIARQRLRALR